MIHVNRKRTVFPATPSEPQQIKLLPLELEMLLVHYIQRGLVYQIPTADFLSQVEHLAETLSRLLVKFYPLAGRLTTSPVDGGIYILCNDSGVDFVEATAIDLSVADLTTQDITPAVRELFPLGCTVNLKGHHLPLLLVQVTQLKDGVAVCCMINHSVADGTSFWHFFNSWAHLCRTNGTEIPINPILNRRLLGLGDSTTVRLGLDPDTHTQRFSTPLRVKNFHFSAHMISCLKTQANQDSPVKVSSLQALCGHLWCAVTRARGLSPEEPTVFIVVVNSRSRLVPPLPDAFFGSFIQTIFTSTTAGELNSLPLSFPVGLLNNIVAGHMDGVIRENIDKWLKEPVMCKIEDFPKNCLLLGSSPRFPIYENDFGWGQPVGIESGPHIEFDGVVSAHPGKEGDGSVDLELCLPPSIMSTLESDPYFLSPSALLLQSKPSDL